MSIRNLAPANDRKKLSDLGLLGHKRNYNKSTVLFSAGDVLDRLFIVEKGLVTLTAVTEKGALITGYRQPGDIIGAEDFLIGIEQPCGLNAVCRTASVIAEVPFDKLHKTATTDTLMLLGRSAASVAKNSICQSADLAMTEIKERLREALKTIATLPTSVTHPRGIKLYHTRQEIAMAVNSSRETVGRLLSILEKEGAVSREGSRIVVHSERPAYRRA